MVVEVAVALMLVVVVMVVVADSKAVLRNFVVLAGVGFCVLFVLAGVMIVSVLSLAMSRPAFHCFLLPANGPFS